MGKATSAKQRQEVVQVWQSEKLSYSALSVRFGLSYNTIKSICVNYQSHGTSSFLSDYSGCGRKVSSSYEKAYRLVRLVRHFHPLWGVPFILTKIRRAYPNLALQSIRTYQSRLKKAFPKDRLPAPTIPTNAVLGKVRQAHDEWQIDAKERIELPSGKQVCFLNITDTKTHAMLKVKPFSLWTNQSSTY